MSIGVPIKLLHEAEGHIVTVETTTGEVYRGKLLLEWELLLQLVRVEFTLQQTNYECIPCPILPDTK